MDDPTVGAVPTTYTGPGQFVSFNGPNAMNGTIRSLDDNGVTVGYWDVAGVRTAFFNDRQIINLPRKC